MYEFISNTELDLYEFKESFEEFSVVFWKDRVIVGNKKLPIGQIAVEFLDISEEVCEELKKHASNSKNKDDFTEIVRQFPFFKRLNVNWNQVDWTVNKFERFTNDIWHFNIVIRRFLEHFIHNPNLRGEHNFAVSILHCKELFHDIMPSSAFNTGYTNPHKSLTEFNPIPNPENPNELIIAERTIFNSIYDLLYMDFFKGLQHGHIPRCCKNCHHWFLLNQGYNTLYCEGIAPNGSGEQTCRQVGAKMTAKEKISASPVHSAYQTFYKKIDARKRRGKISADEYNISIIKALELKEKAFRGEITIGELKEIYHNI